MLDDYRAPPFAQLKEQIERRCSLLVFDGLTMDNRCPRLSGAALWVSTAPSTGWRGERFKKFARKLAVKTVITLSHSRYNYTAFYKEEACRYNY